MQCNMTSGVSIAAGFFFPSFVLFAQFVMLNLVRAHTHTHTHMYVCASNAVYHNTHVHVFAVFTAGLIPGSFSLGVYLLISVS